MRDDNNIYIQAAKNTATIGILAHVGLRFGRQYQMNLKQLQSMINYEERKYNQYQKLTNQDTYMDMLEKQDISSELYRTPDYLNISKNLINETSDADYFSPENLQLEKENIISDDQLKSLLTPDIQEQIDNIQRTLHGESIDTEQITKDIVRQTKSKQDIFAQIEKDYTKTLKALVNQNMRIDLDSISSNNNEYRFTIIDLNNSKSNVITLPKPTGYTINRGANSWTLNVSGVFDGNKIVLPKPKEFLDTTFSNRINNIDKMSNVSISSPMRISNIVSNAIKDIATYERGNPNDFFKRVTFNILDKDTESAIKSEKVRSYQNKPVGYIDDHGQFIKIGRYASSASGESSSKSAIASDSKLFVNELAQDPTRTGSMSRGIPISKKSKRYLLGQGGFISHQEMEYADKMKETSPATMQSVLFVNSSQIGEGETIDLMRHTKHGKTNLNAFDQMHINRVSIDLIENPGVLKTITEHLMKSRYVPLGILDGSDDKTKVYLYDVTTNAVNKIDIQYGKRSNYTLNKFNKQKTAKISTYNEFMYRTFDSDIIANVPNTIDRVMNISEINKYTGGSRSLGFMYQVLMDHMNNSVGTKDLNKSNINKIEHEMWDLAKIIFGKDSIEKSFDSISIVDNPMSHEKKIAIKLKEGTTIRDMDFIMDLENALTNVYSKDKKLVKSGLDTIESIDSRIRNYGTKHENLLGDKFLSKFRSYYVEGENTGVNSPQLLLNKNLSVAAHRFSVFDSSHMISMDSMSRISNIGGKGGVKVNIDMLLSTVYNNQHQFHKYLLSQTAAKHMPYMRSRIQADNWSTLNKQQIDDLNVGKQVIINPGGLNSEREVQLIRIKDIKPELYTGLVHDAENNRALKPDINKIIMESGQLASTGEYIHQNEEVMNKILNDNPNINDVTGKNKSSAMFLSKSATFKGTVELLNKRTDTYLNLELPFAASANMADGSVRDIHAIPLYRVDSSDAIELSVREYLKDGNDPVPVKSNYVTGPKDLTNISEVMSTVADINNRYDTLKTDIGINGNIEHDDRFKGLQKELDLAIQKYWRVIRETGVGKRSAESKKLTSGRMPYSMGANIAYSSELKFGEVGITESDFVKMMSNNKIKNTQAAKKSVSEYRSLFRLVNRVKDIEKSPLPSGMEISDVVDDIKNLSKYEIFSHFEKSTDEEIFNVLSEKDKFGNFSKSIRSLTEENSVIGSKIKTQGKLAKATLDYLDDVKSGKLKSYFELIRNPVLSESSTFQTSVRLLDDSFNISDKVKQHDPRINKSIDEVMYINKLTASMINADHDGDIGNLISKSVNQLYDYYDKYGILKEISKEDNLNTKQLEKLGKESTEVSIKSGLFYKDGDILRPATSSSFQLLHAANEQHKGETKDLKTLSKAIREEYDKAGKSVNLKIDKSNPNWETKLAEDFIKKNKLDPDKEYFVFNDLSNGTEAVDFKDTTDFKSIIGIRSKEQNKKYTEDIKKDKYAFEKYRNSIETKQAARNNIMKDTTPMAFNTAKTLQKLFGLSLDPETNIFIEAFANKTVAQLTISTKKGTPNILEDIVQTLKEFDSPSKSIPANVIADKFARGNWNVPVDENTLSGMKKLGIVDKNYSENKVKYDQYQKYLSAKVNYLNEVNQLHTEKAPLHKSGSYNDAVSKEIEILKKKGVVIDDLDMTSPMAVNYALNETTKELDAANKYRVDKNLVYDPTKAIDDKVNYEYRFKHYKNMFESIQRYKLSTGRNLFDDKSIKPYREDQSISSHTTITDAIRNVSRHITKVGSNLKYKTDNNANVLNAELYSLMSRENINIQYSNTDNNIKNYRMHMESEKTNIRRLTRETMDNSRSYFNEGSLTDNLMGRTKNAVLKSESQVNRVISKQRSKGAMLALLAGSFIGQAINSITTGYSTPGLNDHSGVGGEYYENKAPFLRSVVGSDMELFSRQKKVRAVSGYKESIKGINDIMASRSSDSFYSQSPRSIKQISSTYRGVYV